MTRLRAVPDDADAPAVAIAYGGSGLPITLLDAIEALERAGEFRTPEGWIERVGPDHFRVVLDGTESADGMRFEASVWLDLPPPGLRQPYRDVYLCVPGREPLDVGPSALARAVLACGYGVTPPVVQQGEKHPRRLLWEAPGGLGCQELVAPWAKGEEGP